MAVAQAVVNVDTGESFSGTLVWVRSLGKWLTLRDASLKGTALDGLVRIPKTNISFLQVVR